MKLCKKILLFLFIFIISKNVYAYNDYKVTESSTIDTRSGLYTTCDSDGSYAYCLYYPTIGTTQGEVSKINLATSERTVVKTLTERYFYSAIEVVDNGYLLAGINLSTYKIIVAYYDSSFTLVKSGTFSSNTVATAFTLRKIKDKYYVFNEGISSGNHLAIEVSSDFQTIEFVDELDENDYEYAYAYSYVANNMASRQSLLLLEPFDGGYIGATASLSGSPNGYAYYYKDGEIQWSFYTEDTYIGNLIVKDDRFYATFETTEDYYTTIVEYSSDGEELNSTPISLINDAHRFFLGNFVIGEYNDRVLFLSYLPGSDPSNYATWSQYRIVSIQLSSEIVVDSTSGGSVVVSKNTAFSGDDVFFEIDAKEGYYVSNVTVLDYFGNEVEVTSNNHFVMPNSAVYLRAEFTSLPNPLTKAPYYIIGLIIISSICFIFITLKKKKR